MSNQEIIRTGQNNLILDTYKGFDGDVFLELTVETKYIHDYQEMSLTLDVSEMKILRDYLSNILDKTDTKEMKGV